MLGGGEAHLLQQPIVRLPQGIGQSLNARILYGCHLVDPQPHLFDLLSKRSHLPAPRLVPAESIDCGNVTILARAASVAP